MTAPANRVTYTPSEYIKRERMNDWKSEFLDGEIFAMTGASRPHNLIAGNLFAEIRQQLRGRPCEVYTNDMRVRVSNTGLYAYPDVVVACGPIRFDDDHLDTLLNPMVIVEVLSDSTEAFDRGEKFARYRRLESLQEYVLVSQDKAVIELYRRQGDLWTLSETRGLDAVLKLDAIDGVIPLADIYERVDLTAQDADAVAGDDPGPSSPR
jgi:Uma2 family endonuclease